MGNLNGGKYYQACLEFSTTIKNVNATELYEFGMQVSKFSYSLQNWIGRIVFRLRAAAGSGHLKTTSETPHSTLDMTKEEQSGKL